MTNTVVVDSRFENEPAKIIHKYKLQLSPDPLELLLPVAAHLLHARFIQGWQQLEGQWLLWYEVPLVTKDNLHPIVFQSIATGVPFPKCAKHMATGERWQDGMRIPVEVWHLYEYPSGAKVVDV